MICFSSGSTVTEVWQSFRRWVFKIRDLMVPSWLDMTRARKYPLPGLCDSSAVSIFGGKWRWNTLVIPSTPLMVILIRMGWMTIPAQYQIRDSLINNFLFLASIAKSPGVILVKSQHLCTPTVSQFAALTTTWSAGDTLDRIARGDTAPKDYKPNSREDPFPSDLQHPLPNTPMRHVARDHLL